MSKTPKDFDDIIDDTNYFRIQKKESKRKREETDRKARKKE